MNPHSQTFINEQREVYYPEWDGKPMAETELHRDLMIDLIEGLKAFFSDAPDVHVSGNLLLYYEEGDPRKRVAPDILVVRGVGKHPRRVYKLWEEGKAPDVVFEISSKATLLQDTQRKVAALRPARRAGVLFV